MRLVETEGSTKRSSNHVNRAGTTLEQSSLARQSRRRPAQAQRKTPLSPSSAPSTGRSTQNPCAPMTESSETSFQATEEPGEETRVSRLHEIAGVKESRKSLTAIKTLEVPLWYDEGDCENEWATRSSTLARDLCQVELPPREWLVEFGIESS